jgi:hypothetical protein
VDGIDFSINFRRFVELGDCSSLCDDNASRRP